MESVIEILKEIILDTHEQQQVIRNYQQKGIISLNESGTYEDVKEALECEGYSVLNAKFKDGQYVLQVA